MSNTNKKLSEQLCKTAKIREESWDDKTKSYRLTLLEAANQACNDKQTAYLIDMCLSTAWNDFLDWAEANK